MACLGRCLRETQPVLNRTDFQENQINLSHMQVLRIPGYNEITRLLHISPLCKYEGLVINK